MIPLWGSTPAISVIHDLNFEHQPENLDPVAGGYMRRFYPKFARKSKRVITVSEFCRQDLIGTYQLNSTKVDVVPNAYGEHFLALSTERQKEARSDYSDGAAYYLYLGALNPRKNIDGLLAAYEFYRDAGGRHRLLIVGEKMLWTKDIEEAYRLHKYHNAIHFTGRLNNAELARVLAAAQALCLVSHFEGFGIPILEAFASQTAVICANNTAMPEVAGDAALLVDSRSPQSIAEALLKMEDDSLRQAFIKKGSIRIKEFSWERSAEAMWESISKAIADG